jgi:4,5-DOPA dioxygenase extradiol
MKRAPVYFIGHGSPMNAIAKNDFTEALTRLRDRYPDPRAVLCISAHWMTEGSWVTAMPKPKTIHDFYGFPPELSRIEYPAPGDPKLARHIAAVTKDPQVFEELETWGLDHGTWSVLRHVFPEAKIPVLQLSVYISQPASYHYQLGRQLESLRDRGVLIVGSGNLVHNLRVIRWEDEAKPYDWALEFDEWLKARILARDVHALTEEYQKSEAGRLSIPTPDHYYPFLYSLGASQDDEPIRFEFEGIQNGSISMRTVSFGAE